MPAAGSLRVGRFHADYLVPAAHPEAEGVRSRLDQAARGALLRGLRRTLAPLLDTSDESVWLIRRLHVELEVGAEWDGDRVARAWAAQIARALGRALAEGRSGPDAAVWGDPGEGVLRFPDRAAYLARFLADLAAGDAWRKWYYAAFDGLRPLSASAALRTAVCDDAATGLRALLALPDAERRRVVERLTPNDARRLLDALPAGERGGDPARGWDELRRAWDALPPHAPAADAEARAALELYLRACAGEP
ncbi:MAG TPA: hypothetical protein VHG28_21360, partial [Longimicrobiaceae bacterium]|nr:hypothetical protein [Longimicrobiaceae bacterium]